MLYVLSDLTSIPIGADFLDQMKTIGMVSGIAWPSSIVYYKTINKHFKTLTWSSGLHPPNVVHAQTDFTLIEKAEAEGNWDEVGRLLVVEAQKLKRARADFFLLAYNTVHAADD